MKLDGINEEVISEFCLSGMYRSYYETGKLGFEYHYKNGELDGVFRSYYENGDLMYEQTYKNGVLVWN